MDVAGRRVAGDEILAGTVDLVVVHPPPEHIVRGAVGRGYPLFVFAEAGVDEQEGPAVDLDLFPEFKRRDVVKQPVFRFLRELEIRRPGDAPALVFEPRRLVCFYRAPLLFAQVFAQRVHHQIERVLVIAEQRHDVLPLHHIQQDFHPVLAAIDGVAEEVERVFVGKADLFQHLDVLVIAAVDIRDRVVHRPHLFTGRVR